jgi:hypothetical protein
MRLAASIFRRDFRNYSDDDVLLDTGVSFPIAFASARIQGEEMRLEIPKWGALSGGLSYANQIGVGHGPITGGLFLGSDVGDISETSSFAVSQDQRNTASARLRLQAPRRIWLAIAGEYGSGLPAELSDADPQFLLAQYGPKILSRVNFDRGRVRPNFALDVAAGMELYRREQHSASFDVTLHNLTDSLNLINFESLFSGTAVAPPRSASARLRLTF